MGKFTGVLLASDFDNTLLYTEDALRSGTPVPPLPERNREALEYFMAQGGRFAIATGRALAAFIRYADMVPMNAPGVVCNGAAIYDFEKGEYLETAMLDASARERGQAVLDRFPGVAVEAYHIDNTIHTVHPNDICRQHEHITQAALTEVPSLLDVPLPLGKLLFEAEHEVLEDVLAYITGQGWAEDYELIFSISHLLEMTTRGANKGGMVGRPAGNFHGTCLLRGRRVQRSLNAPRRRPGLRPGQRLRRRPGIGGCYCVSCPRGGRRRCHRGFRPEIFLMRSPAKARAQQGGEETLYDDCKPPSSVRSSALQETLKIEKPSPCRVAASAFHSAQNRPAAAVFPFRATVFSIGLRLI